MQYIAWLIYFLMVSIFVELVAEITKVPNTDEEARAHRNRLIHFPGLAAGFFTGTAVPQHLLPPGPFKGVSVLVLPVFLAAGVAVIGWARGAVRTHFASWSGGAAFGLGLAVGRLIGLAFAAEVQMV